MVRAAEDHFTGRVWLDADTSGSADSERGSLVLFEPGARTNWHLHPGGQKLYVLAGEGWVGSRGSDPRLVRTGDTVEVPRGTEHWHGAAKQSFMAHVGVTFDRAIWGEPVSDQAAGD